MISTILWNIFGVITALLAVGYAYFKWTYQYWRKRNVPFFEPKIPYGSMKNLYSVEDGGYVAEIYKKAKAKGWKYCGMYFMLTPILLVLDMNLVKLILTKDFQHFTDRDMYINEKDDPVGAHLFAISGTKWKNLRAKLTPTFTSGKLKAMFQTLVDCGLVMEKYIEENITEDEPVEIKNILACFSTDIIGSCAFGLDCNSFREPDSLFRQYGNKIFSFTKFRAAQLLFAMNFPRAARAMGIRQVSKDVADFLTKVVQDTVSFREKNKIIRNDFLQLVIDMRKRNEDQENENGDGTTLTMEEIVAQSFIFFAAGFETSSSTMTFALFELSTHPEIQEKVREEIRNVLAKHDDKITYDSISEMKYLGQVIDETMRIHSVARALRRVCSSDYKLPGEDVLIEKGTAVYMSIKGMQYDEEYWENPTEFDPERFSEENKKNINQYTSMPFGVGPRACIGERFGLMQVRVGLTCLLRKYRVRLNEKTQLPLKNPKVSVIASVEGGIWLNLEKI